LLIRTFLILLLALTSLFQTYSQCQIKPRDVEICRNNSVSFSVNTTASSYIWKSGTGLTETKPTATFFYDTRGKFWVGVELYDASSNLICIDSVEITVYDLPKVGLAVSDSLNLCDNEKHCFVNLSKPGADKAPITEYLWLFGDGDLSYQKDPCHKYDILGDYYLFLNVKDSNGCEDKFEKQIFINVLDPISVNFNTNYKTNCPTTDVEFFNKSFVKGQKIDTFIWDFDDGTTDTNTNWTNFTHTYSQNRVFSPTLTIITENGCRKDTLCIACARNIIFDFDIHASHYKSCFEENEFQFFQKINPVINQFYWNFGDPGSGSRNFNGISWDPKHKFSSPGRYNITFAVNEEDCQMDTVLCDYILVKGPDARINVPGLKNNCDSKKLIPKEEFIRMSSGCYNPDGDSIKYVELMKTIPFLVDSVPIYCHSSVQSTNIKAEPCGVDSNIVLEPSSYRKIYDSFMMATHDWYPGDKIPVMDVYFPMKGYCNSQVMHDTDMITSNCGGPNYVRFTNNTRKYRFVDALDDKPPYELGKRVSDRCLNKAFPWASDSLVYFWNFGDPYADQCTSTVDNPDINCNFSTEKVPWHLYKVDGCYKAFLFAEDTITGCKSTDSVQIVMEPPFAAYDSIAYDYINWNRQKYDDRSNRGLIIEGNPCVGVSQIPHLKETFPTCFKEDWGIVFDSTEQCKSFCIDTLIVDPDGNGPDTFVITVDSCEWITKDDWVQNYVNGYKYTEPGCKTTALWIKTGDCYDTFWYSDYKYIHQPKPEFYILDSSTLTGYKSDLQVCTPYFPILTPQFPYQNNIKSYKFEVEKIFPLGGKQVYFYEYLENTFDTSYKFCNPNNFKVDPFTGDTIYLNCFFYPTFDCDSEPINDIPFDTLVKYYILSDTILTLSLTDTIHFQDSLTENGIYEVSGTIEDIYGCIQTVSHKLYLGYMADVFVDSLVCVGDSVLFFDTVSYFFNNGLRPPTIQWDLDYDGVYELKGVHYPKMFYDSSGQYSFRMMAYDSFCGIMQVIDKKNYINAVQVNADFDTLNAPSVCAPQVVSFKNKTQLFNIYHYQYDTNGNLIDSIQIDKIEVLEWEFGDGKGKHSKSYKTDPSHAYTANGEYDVSLIAITKNGCRDTIYKEKYIFIEGPQPRFKLLDTLGCVPYTAKVKDTSLDVSSWIWETGDGKQISGVYKYGDTVEFYYDQPGVYYPTLIGFDSVYNKHLKTWTRCSQKFPDPSQPALKYKFRVVVKPTDFLNFNCDTLICSGYFANFYDLSDPDYTSIKWDFGDGRDTVVSQGIITEHQYFNKPGSISDTFWVSMTGTGAFCPDTAKGRLIYVRDVIANMDTADENKPPIFCFYNLSEGGTKFFWSFEDGQPSNVTKDDLGYVCTNFLNDTGMKEVCLIAQNNVGCYDTVCMEVENIYEVFIHIPNVFTPERSHGVNDDFMVSSKNVENYHMMIFNRWGELVFESYDKDVHWNGLEMNTGEPCPGATYFFVLKYNFFYFDPVEVSGTATLVR
jgi:gliding motility-associated-like protein